MASLRFSLREHKLYAAVNPVVTFSKPSGSVVKVNSTLGSYGRGYAFITVPRAWLDGKYLRFYWKGIGTGSHAVIHKVFIMDGEYDRSSDTDFPTGSDMLSKGNGLLQTVVDPAVNFDWTTVDQLIDVSGGSETNCTIFFQLTDGWSDWAANMEIDWFEINSGSGGSGNLYDEQFTDSVTMEQTGTYGDYGYISTGEIPTTTTTTTTTSTTTTTTTTITGARKPLPPYIYRFKFTSSEKIRAKVIKYIKEVKKIIGRTINLFEETTKIVSRKLANRFQETNSVMGTLLIEFTEIRPTIGNIIKKFEETSLVSASIFTWLNENVQVFGETKSVEEDIEEIIRQMDKEDLGFLEVNAPKKRRARKRLLRILQEEEENE